MRQVILFMMIVMMAAACSDQKPLSVGQDCKENSDCLSGECIQHKDSKRKFCTAPCDSDASCSEGLVCYAPFKRCILPEGRGPGERCVTNTDCARGVCLMQETTPTCY